MSLLPPRWTRDQFTQGVARAIEVFRIERLNEAREGYTRYFDEARAAVEHLILKPWQLGLGGLPVP